MSNSQLRDRINALNRKERDIVLRKTESLFNQFRKLSADGVTWDKDQYSPGTSTNEISLEVVVGVVNDYHNQCKPISKIITDRRLTEFQVIAALCDYAFKQQQTLSIIMDLTQAIQYLYLEQCTVLDLMVLMVANPDKELSAKEVISHLVCLPAHCLMALTILWIELKNQKMANLFEQNWSKITYPKYDSKEFEDVKNDKILDDKQLNGIKEVSEDRTKIVDSVWASMKELDQLINNRPALEVETILSDDFESDVDIPAPTKVNAKWLETDLTNELLSEEIKITPGSFYFVKSDSSQNDMSFTMCQLLQQVHGDLFKVKKMMKPDDADETWTVNRSGFAMGKAPSVRCPEGTRIVAPYNSAAFKYNAYKKTNSPMKSQTCHLSNFGDIPVSSKWFAGTIAVKPLLQNKLQYLVFFDKGMDAYVEPKDIRYAFISVLQYLS
ncbi:hypothetical protein Ddc_03668 [Ditylenchus destructor]|nr:hypothetical protein Ddc_03668 [Ditylenchus destructor]